MTTFESRLAALGGTVSVWCGRPGEAAAYTRSPDVTHYPASTMKVGVMAAAYRLADAGRLDLDTEIPVHEQFTSAVGGVFGMSRSYDSDQQVWRLVGGTASLRWLIRRMIVRSSNLATNLVLEQVGYAAAQEAFRVAGATDSITRRGIEDMAARDAGVDNEITAADLAGQLSAIHLGRMADRASCDEMLAVLADQEFTDDLVAGLPPGTRTASKNGWIDGVRHGATLVYPDDAPPYVLVACATTPLATSEDGSDPVCRTFADLSAVVWRLRHRLGSPVTAA
ncbi:serine hydrolase [Stackebrandtia albiflava]